MPHGLLSLPTLVYAYVVIHVDIREEINCTLILGMISITVNYVISTNVDIWYDIDCTLNMLSAHHGAI